ncbi:MAG: two pore domain potassium channel family protein [Bacillaceae bacterium]|nr:two pore domain potassium channel family protein [Bacillaceae bacterium]
MIYWVLDGLNLGEIVDHYAYIDHEYEGANGLFQSLYFSAITLLAVGYGDLTPFGLSRFVAILEAIVGYTLPAALVVQMISVKKDAS